MPGDIHFLFSKFSLVKREINPVKRLHSNAVAMFSRKYLFEFYIQPAIACSKLTIETLEQGVKYVQS